MLNLIFMSTSFGQLFCKQNHFSEVLSIILIFSHFTLEIGSMETRILCIGRSKVFMQTRARWAMNLETQWMEINNSSLEINAREESRRKYYASYKTEHITFLRFNEHQAVFLCAKVSYYHDEKRSTFYKLLLAMSFMWALF